MIKVIALVGEPATGKTSLIVKLREEIGEGVPQAWKVVKYVTHAQERCIVLGVWDGSTFQGTDRLSMSVQPQALLFLSKISIAPAFDGYTVLIEGDRLGNQKFFNALLQLGIPLQIFGTTATSSEKSKRHQARGDTQSQTWLAVRETKIKKLLTGNAVRRLDNETIEDQARNVATLLAAVREG